MEINTTETKENVICKADKHSFFISNRSSNRTWIGSSLGFLSEPYVLLSNRFFQGHFTSADLAAKLLLTVLLTLQSILWQVHSSHI